MLISYKPNANYFCENAIITYKKIAIDFAQFIDFYLISVN